MRPQGNPRSNLEATHTDLEATHTDLEEGRNDRKRAIQHPRKQRRRSFETKIFNFRLFCLSLSVLEWHRQSKIFEIYTFQIVFGCLYVFRRICDVLQLRIFCVQNCVHKTCSDWFFTNIMSDHILFTIIYYIYDKDSKIWKKVYRRSRSPPQGSSFYGFPRSWAVISQSGRTPFFVFEGDDVKQGCTTWGLSSLANVLKILSSKGVCCVFATFATKMQYIKVFGGKQLFLAVHCPQSSVVNPQSL